MVGSVDPGSPADETSETAYVNTLLGMSANSVLNSGGKTYTTFAYDASGSIVDYLKFDTGTPAPVTGYQFILGKFGNTSYVWELGAGETFTMFSSEGQFPQGDGNQGLSHYSVFNKTTTRRVPDGGTSIALLGMALIGLGGVRKFLGKR
jgi:hypothetical protein